MSSQDVWSVDCDLRRIHVWSSLDGKLASSEPNLDIIVALANSKDPGVILYEIASPVSYIEGRGPSYNLNKWLIYNTAVAMRLSSRFGYERSCRFLVSPSHVWTRGYELKTRHKLAGATAKTKDLRECQTMQYMHSKRPQDWIPLPQFLFSL